VIYEGTSQLHTIIQGEYALGYRQDRALRCEPLPAQGWERGAVAAGPAPAAR
jgi:glutaryl-CoA dehydrogenase (non-decarboxylating)